jgi:integrase
MGRRAFGPRTNSEARVHPYLGRKIQVCETKFVADPAGRDGYVFAVGNDKPMLGTSLNHQYQKIRKLLKLPQEFVLHSLRHTMLTRLGESGADAFTIMRIAGHSSITVFTEVRPSYTGVIGTCVRAPGSLAEGTRGHKSGHSDRNC